MSKHLHHRLASLQQNLTHGRLPRDLLWDDAVSLITHVGQVEGHGGEEFAFTVNEVRELFRRPHAGLMDTADVSRLRRLMKSAKPFDTSVADAPVRRMIVVIDHHVAHIFEDPDGHHLREVDKIEPTDPHHFRHHLVHKKESHYQGDRVPEDGAFYAEIAEALVPASDIVIIGHGTGKSNASAALVEHLRAHKPQIADLVRAQEVADLSALTVAQIEAVAKRHLNAAA